MNDLNNTVSIIIPCYNNEEFVRSAIDSALNQNYPSIQVIVIDDGSSDRSFGIIQSYGDRIEWTAQKNQGAAAARNRGLELAIGYYIKFLDADDVLLPDSILKQVRHTHKIHNDCKAIVYGDAIWVDQHLEPIRSHALRPRQPGEDSVTHILTACPLTSCPLHRRDYLLAVGGFDPALPRGQEHDLHLRLALSGVEFVYHSDKIYKYRNHQSDGRISNHALSGKGALVQFNILKKQQALIESALGNAISPSVKRVMAQRYWQYGRAILREGYTVAAGKYFQAAQHLDAQHCMVGKSPYSILAKWLGPHLAEAVFTGLKHFKHLSP